MLKFYFLYKTFNPPVSIFVIQNLNTNSILSHTYHLKRHNLQHASFLKQILSAVKV